MRSFFKQPSRLFIALVLLAVLILHNFAAPALASTNSTNVTIVAGSTNTGVTPNDDGTTVTYTITGSGAQIGADHIATQLDAGKNIVIDTTTATDNGERGDITASAAIVKSSGSDADITLTANGAIAVNANITNIGAGDITLNANTAGTTTGSFNGIYINGATVQSSGTGNISLNGTGGDGAGSAGIWVNNSGMVSSNSGTITLTGKGPTNDGIRVENSGQVQSGSGDITLTATDSGLEGIEIKSAVTSTSGHITFDGTTTRHGVWITGATATVSTAGNVQIIGNGGAAGLLIDNGATVSTASGTGSITLTGTGGGNDGLRIEKDGRVTSDSGDIALTSTSFGLQGIEIRANTGGLDVVSSTSGNLSFTTDDLLLHSGDIASSGTLTIQPFTASASIGIGGGAGTLNIDAAEISRLIDGFSSITIGDATNGSGAVTVNAITFNDPVTIASPAAGGSITVNGQITGSGGSVTLDGPGASTNLNANIVTAGHLVSISDSVVLGADVSIDTTNGGAVAAGANVTISGTTDADSAANNRTLTINGGTGGDVTLSGAVGGTQALGGLTISNANNVNLADVSLVANGNLTQNDGMGTTTLTGDVATSGTGTVSLTTQKNILLHNGSSITTDSGDITLNANTAGTTAGNFRAVQIGFTSSVIVQSTTGNITLDGKGGDTGGFGVYLLANGTTVKTGGNIQITASASADAGIRIVNAVLVEATGSGTVTIQGTSSSTGSNGHSGVEIDATNITTGGIKSDSGTIQITGSAALGRGIEMDRMGTVSSNSGAITLTGTGGNNDLVDGIYMEEQSQVTTVSGNINLLGTASATGDDGIQLAIGADVTSTSGNITLNGTTADANEGVQIGGDGVTVSTSGNVQITGQSNGGDGILLNVNAAISTSGSGTITMDSAQKIEVDSGTTVTSDAGNITLNANTAGTTTGSFDGIYINGATVQSSGTGNISLDGVAGDAGGTGIWVNNSGMVSSNSGTITLTGKGPTNDGIRVENSGQVQSGSGDITLTATDSGLEGIEIQSAMTSTSGHITFNGTTTRHGVVIRGAAATVSTAGNVQMIGNGGAAGLLIDNGATVSTASGTGSITLTGTGGGNDGLRIEKDGRVISNSGDIALTSTSFGLQGIEIRANTGGLDVVSSTSGNLSFTTDDLLLHSGDIASSGSLTIQPFTASASIGIGGGAGTLNIDAAEISRLIDGFSSITIGDATNGTGTVNIDSATFLDPVTIAGGTINDNAGTDITAPSVTYNGNVAPGLSPGQLVIDGDVTFGNGYTLTLELNGTTAGTQFDQVQVTGSGRTVTLTGATLTGTLGGGYTPDNADELVIIDNVDSGSSVSGTFNGLAEGAEIAIGDYKFTITYAGGTGNDVVLRNPVPLAVNLAFFETEPDTDSVLIRWATVSEQDNLGFNLYRATEIGGSFGQSRLNSELIPAQAPGSGQGAEYEWLDSNVEMGSSYFYWLEDVDVNGITTRHGPISATVNQTTAVTIGELGTSERSTLPAVLSLMLMVLAGGWLLRRR